MPGWHDETRELRDAGRFQMLGIVEEQHPERARLFMQWKQMDWPILVDAQNLLEVPYVPITLGIDEFGIVQYLNPPFADASRLEEAFLDRSYDPPVQSHGGNGANAGEGGATAGVGEAPGGEGDATTGEDGTPAGDGELTAGEVTALAYLRGDYDAAVKGYQSLIDADPDNGWHHFRLGVALRSRFESGARQPDDFQRAVSAWRDALEIDPNNYIWRRRIQQYGPRLDKPYPFYDWIREAREEITARGDEPIALSVEPRGAEFAGPAQSGDAPVPATKRDGDGSSGGAEPGQSGSREGADRPDPDGRITRDTAYVAIRPTVVAHSAGAEKGLRVHLEMTPTGSAHWNNEVDGVQVWLDTPEGWRASPSLVTLRNPQSAESRETRYAEFDLSPVVESSGAANDRASGKVGNQAGPQSRGKASGSGSEGLRARQSEEPAVASGFALYYICEDRNGVCLYRRQDFTIDLSQGTR